MIPRGPFQPLTFCDSVNMSQILKDIDKSGFMPMPWQLVTLPYYFYCQRRDVCGFALRLLSKVPKEKHN